MSETAAGHIQLGLRRPLVARVPWLADLPASAWGYWLVVVAPAAAAVLFATSHLHATGWVRFAVLTVAASIAQLSSIRITRRRVFHPAIMFVVAGALLLSPEQLVLMCLLQHVPDWLKQRYVWYIQPFNIADYVLASLAAWTSAHAAASLVSGSVSTTAVAGFAAASAFVLANRTVLAPMLRLGRGLSLRSTGLLAPEDVTLELVLALMAAPLAALWSHGVGFVVLALAPLTLIHLAQRTMHRLELASETINAQNVHLEEANRQVVERSTAALEALSATVDARDTYTAGHSKRVREYALAIGAALELEAGELEMLSQAALLHDIGKIGVPDSVLLKRGSLTALEWMAMKSHPEEGARIIERLGYLDEVVPAIRHHHERMDGHGYPAGLSEVQIPLAARIIHVADALDAMTSNRVYRDAMTLDEAMDEIRRGRGTDFCARCVDARERVPLRLAGSDAAMTPRLRLVAGER